MLLRKLFCAAGWQKNITWQAWCQPFINRSPCPSAEGCRRACRVPSPQRYGDKHCRGTALLRRVPLPKGRSWFDRLTTNGAWLTTNRLTIGSRGIQLKPLPRRGSSLARCRGGGMANHPWRGTKVSRCRGLEYARPRATMRGAYPQPGCW